MKMNLFIMKINMQIYSLQILKVEIKSLKKKKKKKKSIHLEEHFYAILPGIKSLLVVGHKVQAGWFGDFIAF